MSEVWTTEYNEIFKDRFLKLAGVSLIAPQSEMLEKLAKLKEDYHESLERLTEAYEKKKKIKYSAMAGGVILPIVIGYFIFSGAFDSGLYLLLALGALVGIPYFIFKIWLPRFYKVTEFYKRFRGAEERINFAINLIQASQSQLASETVELFLALGGLHIEKQTFIDKLGTSTSEATFSGKWCTLHLPFAEDFKVEASVFKVAQVNQKQIMGKDQEEFKLQRKFTLHEQAQLEFELDENVYKGILQFRDRDWANEEDRLSIENISAGAHSMGITAGIDLLPETRADKLLLIQAEANSINLESRYVYELIEFVKDHFLKKE